MSKFKLISVYLLFLCLPFTPSSNLYAQTTFRNPILPGSHPDPSICRVGDTYYMVNSTFEYFPGLPIHRSKDLINWELIGYGLDRESQVTGVVNLIDVQSDGGIHAPTIRYHKGLFYIITTNVYYHADRNSTDFVNFIITAKDPAGPWSEPHVLEGAPGIDPDIFFDDGKVWYVGTHAPDNPNFEGEGEIWLQEIDLVNWKLKGKRHYLWRGACAGVWAEGPHMYKYDNRYYLLIAEGGTSFNHAVMIAVSDSITGPFISNERNPILTTRHLSYDNWVHSTGHADLFETQDGNWYAVTLGIRGDLNRASNMGRETFLVPVRWEKEPFEWKTEKYNWPVISPEAGKVLRAEQLPFKKTHQIPIEQFHDNFKESALNAQWNFRRFPASNFYKLYSNEGFLRVEGSAVPIADRKQTSLLGFRQRETDFKYTVQLEFNPQHDYSAGGISLFQKDDNYINFLVEKQSEGFALVLDLKQPGFSEKEEAISLANYKGSIELRVVSKDNEYSYLYKTPEDESFKLAFKSSTNLILSKGYTGAFLGLFCKKAEEDHFSYLDVHRVDVEWLRRN